MYVYDAAGVTDDDNFATMLESFVNILSLCVAKLNTKKVLTIRF